MCWVWWLMNIVDFELLFFSVLILVYLIWSGLLCCEMIFGFVFLLKLIIRFLELGSIFCLFWCMFIFRLLYVFWYFFDYFLLCCWFMFCFLNLCCGSVLYILDLVCGYLVVSIMGMVLGRVLFVKLSCKFWFFGCIMIIFDGFI